MGEGEHSMGIEEYSVWVPRLKVHNIVTSKSPLNAAHHAVESCQKFPGFLAGSRILVVVTTATGDVYQYTAVLDIMCGNHVEAG